MSREQLRHRLEECQLSMAARGQLDGYLPPHLWEQLRQRLQRIYRKATGEPMAVLAVDPPAPVSREEPYAGYDTSRDVSDEEIEAWARDRADDAGFLARKLLTERGWLKDCQKCGRKRREY